MRIWHCHVNRCRAQTCICASWSCHNRSIRQHAKVVPGESADSQKHDITACMCSRHHTSSALTFQKCPKEFRRGSRSRCPVHSLRMLWVDGTRQGSLTLLLPLASLLPFACDLPGFSMKTPLVKETLDVELWEERRVKDTPHGFFAKMMGREAAKVPIAFSGLGLVSILYAAVTVSCSLLTVLVGSIPTI